MTPAETIAALREAFRDVARPSGLFIEGTCFCCECQEHNQALSAHNPETIGLKELENPGWDPMCFANQQAFAYYLPAMIRLAFEDPYYMDQVVFHLTIPGRVDSLTPRHAAAVLAALWSWWEFHTDKAKYDWDVTDTPRLFDEALRRLEAAAKTGAG